MVAVLLDADVRTLLDGGIRTMAEQILNLLTNAPLAFASFVAAVALVGFGVAHHVRDQSRHPRDSRRR